MTTPDQPRDRGICGAFAPTLAVGETPICTLMAEHPGWHGDREGMSWADQPDAIDDWTGLTDAAAHEMAERLKAAMVAHGIDVPPTQADVDAAHARGVAEGRRQATEGWEREWGVIFEPDWYPDPEDTSRHIPIPRDDESHTDWTVGQHPDRPRRKVSRLVGPWEAAEQAEPSETERPHGAFNCDMAGLPHRGPCDDVRPMPDEQAGGDRGEVECPKSKRVDGQLHSTRWDGDDSRTICVYCGEVRDALTGAVLQEGRRG